MKKNISLVLFLVTFIGFPALLVSGQANMRIVNNTSLVSLSIVGNENLQVSIDSKESSYNNRVNDKTTINYNNLELGQHTLLVTRTTPNKNREDRISTIFNLRRNYDMLIKVNGNGSLELIETKKSGWTGSQAAMNNNDFNILLRNVRFQRSANAKSRQIESAFNANNYFTTAQVVQLIQLVNAENLRLQLAKQSVSKITDRNNLNQISNLLNSQPDKIELEEYVKSYDDETDAGTAMSDTDFNNLFQSIQRQYPVSRQVNSLTEAFNNSNNYFSVYQIKQLIQIVSDEPTRMDLAKLSYRSVTDPGHFSDLNNLFQNQSTRDELSAYINNFNGNEIGHQPMTDNNFTNLYQSIQRQYFPNEKMTSLKYAFNLTGNYFTSLQGKQLIQLVSLESNKLELAKLSYRTITDRLNFNQIYNLFEPSNKVELESYVKAYRD